MISSPHMTASSTTTGTKGRSPRAAGGEAELDVSSITRARKPDQPRGNGAPGAYSASGVTSNPALCNAAITSTGSMRCSSWDSVFLPQPVADPDDAGQGNLAAVDRSRP